MPTEQDILSDTRTCGELSCDDCNERFAAAQKVIAELQSHEPYQRLKADIDRGMGCAGCDRCLEDIEEEIAGMRRDAERYRWLREQHWNTSPLAVVCNPKDAVKLGHDLPSLERLDAAIDVAIRSAESGKNGC
jgi:hypothetical protein